MARAAEATAPLTNEELRRRKIEKALTRALAQVGQIKRAPSHIASKIHDGVNVQQANAQTARNEEGKEFLVKPTSEKDAIIKQFAEEVYRIFSQKKYTTRRSTLFKDEDGGIFIGSKWKYGLRSFRSPESYTNNDFFFTYNR